MCGRPVITFWLCGSTLSTDDTRELAHGTQHRTHRSATRRRTGNWHDSGGRPEQQEGWLEGPGARGYVTQSHQVMRALHLIIWVTTFAQVAPSLASAPPEKPVKNKESVAAARTATPASHKPSATVPSWLCHIARSGRRFFTISWKHNDATLMKYRRSQEI